MKDKNDLQTIDLISKPGRGRPKTSNPDKKKKDAATRAKRHREKLKSSPRLSNEKIKDTIYFLEQEFRWMENCFLENGNFAEEHSKENALQHRNEMIKKIINLCELLGETELKQKFENRWKEYI